MGIWLFQAGGVALAVLLLVCIRTFSRSVPRALAIVLFVASVMYVAFALAAGASAGQLLVEVAGLVAYGALAWLGLTRSTWWLVAGWALHPAWDVGLHLLGPAKGIAPAWYAHACLTFDLVVAGYLVQQIRRQRLGSMSRVQHPG